MKIKSELFSYYKALATLQTRHNLVIPWTIEKFIGKALRYFCSVASLSRPTSKYHYELINSISSNLIQANFNTLTESSLSSSSSSSPLSSFSSSLSKRCVSDYQVTVVESKFGNAKAWIGGGITIDDSFIDTIAKEYSKDIISSTTIAVSLDNFDMKHITIDLSSVELHDILACILAHEMSHIAMGHLSISLTFYIIITIILSSILDINNNKSDTLIIPFLLLLNRLHEHDADCNGLQLAYKAGYNPLGG